MGASVKTNEPVTFFEWNGTGYDIHEATVRVFPGNPGNSQHPRAHLIVVDEADGSTRMINNVDNEETANIPGNDYYRRRFSDWGD